MVNSYGKNLYLHENLPDEIPACMKRIAIIDDEPDARETLHLMVATYCPEVHIAGIANGVADGFRMICREKPDIVLLDIRMDDGSGFDLLDMFPQPKFKVIFTTAYDEFALRAFRYHALDYLLKPVTPMALVDAIDRAVATSLSDNHRNISVIKENHLTGIHDKIAINTREGVTLLNLSSITRFEADSNYSWAYPHQEEKVLIAKSMSEFEDLLPQNTFFRIHQSYIVNIRYIKKYLKEGNIVVLDDNTELSIARRRKDDFLEWLEKSRRE